MIVTIIIIIIIIYSIGMIIFDAVVLKAVMKQSKPWWQRKMYIKTTLVTLGIGLIWPVCLVSYCIKASREENKKPKGEG